MLNRIIQSSFAVIGAVTGFTLMRTLFSAKGAGFLSNLEIPAFIIVSCAIAVVFYSASYKFIELLQEFLDRIESKLQNMTLYELTICAGGLIAGLIIANLATIPLSKVKVIGLPLAVTVNLLFGCIGISLAVGKKNESFQGFFKSGKAAWSKGGPKLLDTSVIIDGRIADICRAGFIEGEFIIPLFILEELRHIADSPDPLRRNRGRRGLDVLNILQKDDMPCPVRVEEIETSDAVDVDDRLILAAKKLGGRILTTDYNLSKVALVQDVSVMNINELANAVKPIALPGEEMTVHVIKDGKENGQGIGYLNDGTMIVVDGGRRHIGEEVSVTVTSVLQTAAGRMIFAKPKGQIERMIERVI